MDLSDYHYIVYMSVKDEKGKLIDQPLFPCIYENDANNYITGYVHAIINHTGTNKSKLSNDQLDKLEAEVRGQFSIRDVTGLVVDKNEGDASTNKETENV